MRSVEVAIFGSEDIIEINSVFNRNDWWVLAAQVLIAVLTSVIAGAPPAARGSRDDRGRYREAKLGLADDLQDANGGTFLDFTQAQRAARVWCNQEQRLASGLGEVVQGPYTVARAMAD